MVADHLERGGMHDAVLVNCEKGATTNIIFPCLLDVMDQPSSSVCETRVSLGLMINAGMLLDSGRRIIFGGPVITLGLTGKSLSAMK